MFNKASVNSGLHSVFRLEKVQFCTIFLIGGIMKIK